MNLKQQIDSLLDNREQLVGMSLKARELSLQGEQASEEIIAGAI